MRGLTTVFKTFVSTATLLAAAMMLSGCGITSKSAYAYYDQCRAQTASFVEMAECGKRTRNASCSWNCSREGDALVSYADALVMQVRNREMSDGEAFRRFAEYKTQFIHELRRANSTTVCIPTNNMVICD